jgi:hypothetical protein
MSINESGSAEQGRLVPATVKTTRASAEGVLASVFHRDWRHAGREMP